MVIRPCSLLNCAIVTFGTRDVFLRSRVAYLNWRRFSFCIFVESFVKLIVTVDFSDSESTTPVDRKDLVHPHLILHSVCTYCAVLKNMSWEIEVKSSDRLLSSHLPTVLRLDGYPKVRLESR